MLPRIAALAFTAAALHPSASDAATVAVAPCVNAGAPVPISGTGFNPSATVIVDFSSGGPVPFGTDALGAFAATVKSPPSPTSAAALTAGDGIVTATAQARVVAPRLSTAPDSGPIGRAIRLRGEGFPRGKRLWAHVRHGGRTLWRKRLPRSSGPCGSLRASSALLVHRRGRRVLSAPPGRVTVTINDRRRYRASTRPSALMLIDTGSGATTGRPIFIVFGTRWRETPFR